MRNLLRLMTLVIALPACHNLELTTEQCSPFMGERDQVCFCRQYHFGKNFVGPIAHTEKDHPIEYCNQIVGFKDYATTATFWERVRRAINGR
jgi:hypothetical protein